MQTTRFLAVVLAGVLAICLPLLPARAEKPAPAPAAEPGPEPSYGYAQAWKLTFSVYRSGTDWSGDLNLRGSSGDFNFWLGGYAAGSGDGVARIGGEWAYKSETLRVTPTLAVATNGLVAGQLYAEIGQSAYLIAGASRTNLKDYYNLTFDPNESLQLGAGLHLDASTLLNVYSIFDIRLHTGQQNTHFVFRHYVSHEQRLTVDIVYKSGHTDEDELVRAIGATVTWDWARFFVRAAYDPYASFTGETMVRLGAGLRF
jgi:hypothetical protein